MFARFRLTAHRLQVSLVQTRRINGAVRHEHIASLGSIARTLSVADRVAFWSHLYERLAKLSNRIAAAAQAEILGAIHARVPMVTADEQHNLKLENAQADERVWSSLRDMNDGTIADHKQLIARTEAAVAQHRAAALEAETKSTEARDRVERLKRGEDVSGGFAPPLDFEQILRRAGWTKRDMDHARLLASLPEDAIPAIVKASVKASEREARAAARRYARVWLEQLEQMDMAEDAADQSDAGTLNGP